MDERNDKELKKVIEDSVDESVDRAFRRYLKGLPVRKRSAWSVIRTVIVLAAVAVLLFAGYRFWRNAKSQTGQAAAVESHDETIENNGIFGFKTADFAEPILGRAEAEKQLIVEEKDASVNTTVTDAGFMNWNIFTKTQVLTIHGTGEYTIDLSEITADDISLDEDSHVVTVVIPHAELHTVTFDPDKTEVGDTERGWLAFGSIEMDAEETKEFESTSKQKLTEALGTDENMEEADRFARLAATEELQKIVDSVSPSYKVQVVFQDNTTNVN